MPEIVLRYDLRTPRGLSRASGMYRVLTPEACVELGRGLGERGVLVLHPLMGGLPPELGWQSLELFDAKVLPALAGDPPSATSR